MSKITPDTIATFLWAWCNEWFLETVLGNWIWSDPEYDGDNTIKQFEGTLEEFLKQRDIPFVRDKGLHRIGDYCGPDVKIVG